MNSQQIMKIKVVIFFWVIELFTMFYSIVMYLIWNIIMAKASRWIQWENELLV